MITYDRFKKVILLSLPIIGGMISQNLLNLVDTAMVGQLGAVALAAVGIGSYAIFMSQSLVLGLSTGVQAVVSRRVGEGNLNVAGKSLSAGVVIAIILGVLLSVLIYPFVPVLFSYLNGNSEVAELAVPYWRIRLFAVVFMGINYAFRGYFNGISQPKYYMFSLVSIHIVNVVLNYILIYGHFGFPAMGTDGAALASALSTVVGSLIFIALSITKPEMLTVFSALPKLSDIRQILKLTVPAGFQQFMIAVGISSLFWVVGKLGVTEVAVLNILINVLLLCILPGFGFGMASATLVGTSLGERDFQKAKLWAYDVTKVGGILTLMAGLLISYNAAAILSLFTQDADTLKMALVPLQITGMFIFVDVISVIMMNSLLGSGDVKIVLRTSIVFQWIVFFPIALVLVEFFEPEFLVIWLLFIFSRLGQGGVYFYHWHKDKWGQAKF